MGRRSSLPADDKINKHLPGLCCDSSRARSWSVISYGVTHLQRDRTTLSYLEVSIDQVARTVGGCPASSVLWRIERSQSWSVIHPQPRIPPSSSCLRKFSQHYKQYSLGSHQGRVGSLNNCVELHIKNHKSNSNCLCSIVPDIVKATINSIYWHLLHLKGNLMIAWLIIHHGVCKMNGVLHYQWETLHWAEFLTV